MRLLIVLLLGAAILGGVYHARIEQYVRGVFEGPPVSAGTIPMLGGVRKLGQADNALLTGAAHALHR